MYIIYYIYTCTYIHIHVYIYTLVLNSATSNLKTRSNQKIATNEGRRDMEKCKEHKKVDINFAKAAAVRNY